jgi:hypothetical protein
MKLNVVFNANEYKKNRNIIGEIFFDINSYAFPEKGWTDFVIILLCWWTEEFLNQINGKKIGEYNFMEGPFSIKIEFINNQEILMECFERKKQGVRTIGRYQFLVKKMHAELKYNVNSVIRECIKNNYENDDVEKLKKNYEKLSHINL